MRVRARSRRWFRLRVAVYVVVIAALLVWRSGGATTDWLRSLFEPPAPARVSIGGMDLGRPFLTKLLDLYARDDPELTTVRLGGGTVQALEALLAGQIDVGLLCRLPTPVEQAQFEKATGDTLSYHRFALGALRLLGGASLGAERVRSAELRDLFTGRPTARFDRLYTLDPNLGLWNVLHERLGLDFPDTQRPPSVFFLPDASAVRQRLGADPRALGILSSLCDAGDDGGEGAVVLPWHDEETEAAIDPSDENVAAGSYPLYHYLYAATRPDVSIHGAKLVTHLVSDRGQRQVWRCGALPARIAGREILLNTRPLDARDR
ncbi:MAG TPA: substrate-binding domain-containing protein [Candidatus Krumholzibacteria bacterium]